MTPTQSVTGRVFIRNRAWRIVVPLFLLCACTAIMSIAVVPSWSAARVWALESYWNLFWPSSLVLHLALARFPSIALWGLSPRTNIGSIIMDRTAMVCFQVGSKIQATASLAVLVFIVHVEVTCASEPLIGSGDASETFVALAGASRSLVHVGGGIVLVSIVHRFCTRTLLVHGIRVLLRLVRRGDVVDRFGNRHRGMSTDVDAVTGVSDAAVFGVLHASPRWMRATHRSRPRRSSSDTVIIEMADISNSAFKPTEKP